MEQINLPACTDTHRLKGKVKTSAAEGDVAAPGPWKGVTRGEDAVPCLPRVSQVREAHVKGRGRNSPTERGASRQDSLRAAHRTPSTAA